MCFGKDFYEICFKSSFHQRKNCQKFAETVITKHSYAICLESRT
jgi:hypothetical protein